MARADHESEVPEGAAVLPRIPAELGVDPILLALLHAVVFLSGSEDDVVDPEASEEAMEYVATYLQRLEGARLDRIREDLLTLTSFAKQEGWAKSEIRFLKDFLAEFGIGTERKKHPNE
jgi:hypothetical protein